MRRWIVGGLIALAVLAAVYVLVARTGPVPVRGLAPAGTPPFEPDGTIDVAGRALYSPDGTQLAVLSPAGLVLAQRGEGKPVTQPGTNVVDAAWFPVGTALLVAEGPTPTGTVAVVETDGTIRGNIPLSPSVGFGTGHGMSVAPGGRRAVVTAVERPALAGEQRFLVLVDLETGTTRPLTPAGGPDEYRPSYLDAGTIVFTQEAVQDGAGGRTDVVSIEIDSGVTTVLAPGGRLAGVVGGGRDAAVAVQRAREISVLAGRPGEDDFRLGSLPEGATLIAIHPAGGEAVVSEIVTELDGSHAPRFRRIGLKRLPL